MNATEGQSVWRRAAKQTKHPEEEEEEVEEEEEGEEEGKKPQDQSLEIHTDTQNTHNTESAIFFLL